MAGRDVPESNSNKVRQGLRTGHGLPINMAKYENPTHQITQTNVGTMFLFGF